MFIYKLHTTMGEDLYYLHKEKAISDFILEIEDIVESEDDSGEYSADGYSPEEISQCLDKQGEIAFYNYDRHSDDATLEVISVYEGN